MVALLNRVVALLNRVVALLNRVVGGCIAQQVDH